jgi:Peptidase A4 family
VLLVFLIAAAFGGWMPTPSAAAAVSSTTSSNWAGYVVHRSGTRFRRVSGSWAVPTATCSPGIPAYSASWVGIGGFSTRSQGLEQTGTDSDCGSSGQPVYTAWYELLPAGAVTVHMDVHPGDRIDASVEISGPRARFHLIDRTTRRSVTATPRVSVLDETSADWIEEAPASCSGGFRCIPTPLANFGSVTFTRASATSARGHTATISSPAWSATKITLGGGDQGRRPHFGGELALGSALPSDLTANGSAFTVSYQAAQPVPTPTPPPTYPGGTLPGI